MPNINKVPVPEYRSLDPYHFFVDNLPITGLSTQMFLVNAQVDNNANDLRQSIGNAGTLGNRLNKSLEDDGSIKTIAIDNALHSIKEHIDAGGFVRMTDDERDKLSLIADEATKLTIDVTTISGSAVWPGISETLVIKPSSTISWRTDMTGALLADTTVGLSVHHIHHYDIIPVTSDSINFVTTAGATPYNAGSLRVYVNGLHLTSGVAIEGYYYTETDPAAGEFTLNTALGGGDLLRIDFNQPIT